MVSTAVDSPWGPMRIAAGEHGVVAAELLATPEGFASGLERRGFTATEIASAGPGPATAHALRASAVLAAMLAGDRVDASEIAVDVSDRPAWDRLVLGAVRTIPYGRTASYGEVARWIGRPGAARAVGGAVGRNPVGLLVPCHRVIAGDGSLGGYGAAAWGGVEAALALKRGLLALEGVEVR